MISLFKSAKATTTLLFLAGLSVLLFFFALKCLHLQHSHYTSDLFCHYQLSHDWLLGKPLLYENCFGFHGKIHNYFIDLILAPFSAVFGVYGLFVALLCLFAGSLFAGLKSLENQSLGTAPRIILCVLYVSPLSFFIFHNEHYGFHVETLLIPLAVLFCTASLRKSRWSIAWAMLMILVKEDAVLVAWSCLMLVYLSKLTQGFCDLKSFIYKAAISGLACLIVLAGGMLWLKYQNHWQTSRSGEIIEKLCTHSLGQLWHAVRYVVAQRLLLTVPFVILVAWYGGRRFALGAVLLSAPILLVNLLAGMIYLSDSDAGHNVFSLLWVPRLSMYWAYWLCAMLLALLASNSRPVASPVLQSCIFAMAFCLMLFGYQYWFFKQCEVTRFDVADSIRQAFEVPFQNTGDAEFATASAIAEQLPEYYPVAPMDRVFGAFRRQDIVWLNYLNNAFYKPRMILASYNTADLPKDIYQVMKRPRYMLQGDLHIYCEAEDTVYVSRAGILGTWTIPDKP